MIVSHSIFYIYSIWLIICIIWHNSVVLLIKKTEKAVGFRKGKREGHCWMLFSEREFPYCIVSAIFYSNYIFLSFLPLCSLFYNFLVFLVLLSTFLHTNLNSFFKLSLLVLTFSLSLWLMSIPLYHTVSPSSSVGEHITPICNGLNICAEANLDVQYMMAIAQDIPTTYVQYCIVLYCIVFGLI